MSAGRNIRGAPIYATSTEPPAEGELYRTLEIEGVTLDIFYGYYDPERERGVLEPMPIFPDFQNDPTYTELGYMLVNADGDVCEHFSPKAEGSEEGWCNDCRYLELHDTCLGVCRCEQNRKNE
nr:hypothetical protein [Clostridia bacterium]